MAKTKKFYVVWNGRSPGIYEDWEACKAQIHEFPDAKYKSFTTLLEAQSAFNTAPAANVKKHLSATSAEKKNKISTNKVIWESISVDAACSGNPGVMEYQGVETKSGKRIFHQQFKLGTNNIGEFLGIVHGMGYLEKLNLNIPIYSDSKIAIGWVEKEKAKSKLVLNKQTEYLHQLIERAENWLATNEFRVPILKWETAQWGEIPADFGRK